MGSLTDTVKKTTLHMRNESIPPVSEFSIPLEELKIDVQTIAGLIGYKTQNAPDFYLDRIAQILDEASRKTHLRIGYRLLPTESFLWARTCVKCCDVEFSTGKIIALQMKKSTTAAIFAGTAGEVFDTWSKRLFAEGDYPGGYIVDTLGSEMVERAADRMEEKLQADLADGGLRMTNRFSPGYCGWSVHEQHKLFSLLPPKFCGITLTDSALMVPVKSVSGIIGIGQEVKRKDYPCAVCDMQDCFRRRSK